LGDLDKAASLTFAANLPFGGDKTKRAASPERVQARAAKFAINRASRLSEDAMDNAIRTDQRIVDLYYDYAHSISTAACS
jgi:hypothetical protein